MEGKLTNAEGEFIASGLCEVHLDKGEVTMWPSFEAHMLERERGELSLDLGDGRSMRISDRHLTFKLQGATEQRMSVYRLRILPEVPEHLAAGYSAPAAQTPAPSEAPETTAQPRPTLRVVTGQEDGGR